MANVPDSKKCQTFVNVIADTVAAMRAQLAILTALRAKFLALNPTVAGTPLAGRVAGLNSAYGALVTALADANFDAMIAARVPSHHNVALD